MLEMTSTRNSRTPLLYVAVTLAVLAILIPIRVVAADRAPEARPAAKQSAEAVTPSRDSAADELPQDSAEEIDRLGDEIALLAERSAQKAQSDSRHGGLTSTVPSNVQRRIQELARRVERLAQRQAQRGLQLARRHAQRAQPSAPVQPLPAAELAQAQQEMELAAVESAHAQLAAQRAEERALARAYAAPSEVEEPSEELY